MYLKIYTNTKLSVHFRFLFTLLSTRPQAEEGFKREIAPYSTESGRITKWISWGDSQVSSQIFLRSNLPRFCHPFFD
jgi:hypothetical protein